MTQRHLSRLIASATIVAGALFASGGSALAGQTIPNGANVSFTATSTVTPAPASNFAASGGGDGWSLAFNADNVYNIFHHQATLKVECHVKVTGSECTGYPKLVQDGAADFSTSGQPSMYLDESTNQLYVYASNVTTNTGGVVKIDLNSSSSNPFVSFTPLVATGDSPVPFLDMCGDGAPATCYALVTNGVMVGTKWYSFNTVAGDSTGDRNKMMCFDFSTKAACTGQPYAVNFGGGSVWDSIGNVNGPAAGIATVAGKVFVNVTDGAAADGSGHLACFDPSTNTSCSGSWPVATGSMNIWHLSPVFPILNASGAATGVCQPETSVFECFNLDGSAASTPTGMTDVFAPGTSSRWNGPAVVIGARMYYTLSENNSQACYDYSKPAPCANFPVNLASFGAGYTYTTNVDPSNPSCLWVNSDNGSSQIVSFDAYTGGQCSSTTTRVLLANFVVPGDTCHPATYDGLTITSPLPAAYHSGTVTFQDGSGNDITGVPVQNLDSTGHVDLSGLNLQTSAAIQMVVSLPGAETDPIHMSLTWSGSYDPTCVLANTTVDYKEVTTTTTTPLAFTGSNTASTLWLGAVLFMLGGALLVATRRRTTDQ